MNLATKTRRPDLKLISDWIQPTTAFFRILMLETWAEDDSAASSLPINCMGMIGDLDHYCWTCWLLTFSSSLPCMPFVCLVVISLTLIWSTPSLLFDLIHFSADSGRTWSQLRCRESNVKFPTQNLSMSNSNENLEKSIQRNNAMSRLLLLYLWMWVSPPGVARPAKQLVALRPKFVERHLPVQSIE